MARKEWFGLNRAVLVLTVAFSLVFLAFSVTSAVTYSKINLAQEQIVMENEKRVAEILPNGTLFIGFSVRIVNPSEYVIHVASISWYSEVLNGTSAIPLASNYTTENLGVTIAASASTDLAFGWFIVGDLFEQLKGFINYSDSKGVVYTLLTAPYAHSFEFRGWLDDFKHDYLRENYLNGLVTVDLRYTYGLGET